jgi:hypothetical protein
MRFARQRSHTSEETMANDRDNPDKKKNDIRDPSDSEHKRVIGKGMTSPDSTQVPLKAETGEPDWDAIKGRVPKDSDEDESP